ncbi:cellulase family glycosylhydrolase [Cellulomonas sp. Root137]|uniref:cellulase family glycosylhydrolase n=1 Tax=Cellulomonas sp. Root137 TaxID=1736459 RepID=UPI0006F25683|nr:cellulase family glycosylhydrolase [Cellulomonas sp. Root137]KQY44547.1 hypothetical protein ASD18_13660 [Cellulomonas sp. Root137]
MTTPTRRGPATYDGYVHAHEGALVDGTGRPLLLRGIGLGTWLLPEGYMWGFDGGPQSPREIEALVRDLVGPDRAGEFWVRFRDAFVTDADIARIAGEGFDHVRLPINSRLMLDDEGALRDDAFELIDRTIAWCRAHGLWVILDLHGAPGGQTGTNIDDSPNNRPELFEDDRYRAWTVHLWRAIATRYADETVVAGYDLLNEPLPNQWQDLYADRLVDLYLELTSAIRQVDTAHLLIYEGTHWSTNWSIFTEVWDPNSMLQFHKYWSAPDFPSIERFVRTGRDLGLPVYMGEGGENNPAWLATAFQLYEDHRISWNFWTWKKLDTVTSPFSVIPPAGWADVVAYAAGHGARPSPDDAWSTLDRLVDAVRVESCAYRPTIVNALLRRVPVELPAMGFSFRGPGTSHHVRARTTLPGLREDDGVALRYDSDTDLHFDLIDGRPGAVERDVVVDLDAGEWVAYDIHVDEGRRATVVVTADGPVPDVDLDGVGLGSSAAPGRWEDLLLTAGRHVLRVVATRDASSLRRISIH